MEVGARPLVKICGIREEATVADMNGLPVHYVGFVFAKSRRQVTAEQAARLREAVGRSAMAGGAAPLTVGVFVNPTMEELADAVAAAKLDVVQLHGDETPDFCREVGSRFGVEVWRALSVDEEEAEESGTVRGPGRLEAYKGAVSAVLLDTAGGGTGRTFRWERIPSYLERAHRLGFKLFVAGGLNPENVDELLSRYEPDGVDISSGVETDGVKDIGKIAAFAERVKRG
ncbi:phosphoribosylanthranilate isomerase [Cohnella sp. CBP 2801]|uniref:N-(5'-phosphoribosyl)anthranilate isomerase n=2 Tax=Cohnella zeiphila TaxID=2761120 RepID=A0A7X0VZH8_9BACL|nr:phosphoribosylanthranilate isomerase [Cohnella zeiphila]